MEQIILARLERGDKIIGRANLSYSQKLLLVDSFNILEDRIIQSLNILNRVRNSCVHKKEKKVTRGDIDLIGSPLGKEYSKKKREYGNNIGDLFIDTLIMIGVKLMKALYESENN